MGVFATRSPVRVNPIGLSAVRLKKVNISDEKIELEISGHDFLDGTPVLDIRPYSPEVDCITNASNGRVGENPMPKKIKVIFSNEASKQLQNNIRLKNLIEEVLSLDPRPRYKNDVSETSYAMKPAYYDVKWQIQNDYIKVVDLVKLFD